MNLRNQNGLASGFTKADKASMHPARIFLLLTLGFALVCRHASAQPSPFTYQGRLLDNGVSANGNYDLAFRLFDAVTNGSPVSGSRTNFNVAASNGLFTVTIDFGSPTFFTTNRWLNISVRSNGTGTFTNLSPRQALTAAPMALFALTTPPVVPATSGQNVVTVFGSGGLVVTPSTGATLIPGLTQTIDVPASSVLFITTDGAMQTTSAAATGFSVVDITVNIDGSLLPNGGYARIYAANTTGLSTIQTRWAISLGTVLTAGSHTISVNAAGVGSGSNATVSGNNSSVLQGELSVLILKQ